MSLTIESWRAIMAYSVEWECSNYNDVGELNWWARKMGFQKLNKTNYNLEEA